MGFVWMLGSIGQWVHSNGSACHWVEQNDGQSGGVFATRQGGCDAFEVHAELMLRPVSVHVLTECQSWQPFGWTPCSTLLVSAVLGDGLVLVISGCSGAMDMHKREWCKSLPQTCLIV